MFYQKYRPQVFSEVSKPNDTALALSSQITENKIAHSYLFIGPRGTGKTTTARIFAKALNCKDPQKNGDSCDKCESCKAISAGRYIDLIEIDAASNRGIDDIRALKDSIGLTPFSSKYKVYIIDEVHMLTLEAFNALLKTLEEPPKHAVIILCTTESHKVPDTIKSRCQVFKFKRPTVKQIMVRLEDICAKEAKELSKETLQKVAVAAYGGFRDAETILEQVLDGGVDVESLLGSNMLETFIKLSRAIIAGKSKEALEIINKLFEDGTDLVNWTNEYIRYLRDLLYVQAGYSKGVSDVPDDIFAIMEDQSKKLEPSQLVFIIEKFMKATSEIKTSAIHQLPVELAIIASCEMASGNSEAKKPTNTGPKKGGSPELEFTVSEEFSDFDVLDALDGKKNKNPKEEVSQGTEDVVESVITLQAVIDSWNDILKTVKPYNHSVEALLRSCKPKDVDGGWLILEVAYAFHKDRLEAKKSREILEKALSDIFGAKLRFRCELRSKSGESLTDRNIEIPAMDAVETVKKAARNAMNVFDGNIEL